GPRALKCCPHERGTSPGSRRRRRVRRDQGDARPGQGGCRHHDRGLDQSPSVPAAVHVLYLVGWGNPVAAAFNWARVLTFSKNRPYRTITYEHARDELAGVREPGGAGRPDRAGSFPWGIEEDR